MHFCISYLHVVCNNCSNINTYVVAKEVTCTRFLVLTQNTWNLNIFIFKNSRVTTGWEPPHWIAKRTFGFMYCVRLCPISETSVLQKDYNWCVPAESSAQMRWKINKLIKCPAQIKNNFHLRLGKNKNTLIKLVFGKNKTRNVHTNEKHAC